MKSGCGFYISDDINYIPRKDLDTHFYNQTNEYSCKWIEVVNKKNLILLLHLYIDILVRMTLNSLNIWKVH